MKKLHRLFLCCGLCCAARAFAADEADYYTKNDKGETVWALTDYLHGTTAEVRAILNKDTDRLTISIGELQHDVDDLEKQIEPERKKVLDAVRASRKYLDLTEEMKQADAARKAADGLDKLDASSRFNKARLGLTKMEQDAMRQDSVLADDQKELDADQKQIVAQKASLLKAEQWRAKLVHAIRSTFELTEPLRPGRHGLISEVTVAAIKDEGPIGQFEAAVPGTERHGKTREGIESSMVEAHKVSLLLLGSYPAKVGHTLPLNRSFEVDKIIDDPKFEIVFVMKPVTTEADLLLDGMPVGEVPPAATKPSR